MVEAAGDQAVGEGQQQQILQPQQQEQQQVEGGHHAAQGHRHTQQQHTPQDCAPDWETYDEHAGFLCVVPQVEAWSRSDAGGPDVSLHLSSQQGEGAASSWGGQDSGKADAFAGEVGVMGRWGGNEEVGGAGRSDSSGTALPHGMRVIRLPRVMDHANMMCLDEN